MSEQVTLVPAAFINNIADEGTKAEAIEWLQNIWNAKCHFECALSAERAKRRKLEEKLVESNAMLRSCMSVLEYLLASDSPSAKQCASDTLSELQEFLP